MADVREGLLPLFWLEVSGDLGETELRRIKTEVTKPIHGYHVIQWMIIGLGTVVIVLGFGYLALLLKKEAL